MYMFAHGWPGTQVALPYTTGVTAARDCVAVVEVGPLALSGEGGYTPLLAQKRQP